MSKCHKCGVEIQEGATICWICQRKLVYQDDNWVASSIPAVHPSAMGSFLLAILILLAFGMTGYVLFEWNARLAGLFGLFFSLFIGWWGTRGRYIIPTLRQYLLTMLISLLPVLGTAYGLFFTGRYLTEHRGLRYMVYLCLISSVALLLFWKTYQGEYDLGKALSFLKLSVKPTSTAPPSITQTPRQTPSATPRPSSTYLPTRTLATTENPALAGCLHWSSITVDMVGQDVCVYGDYLNISQRQDNTYVMSFSDQTGTFQIWSYPKPFEPYLSKNGDRCVVIRGWMKTSGVRLIMIIGPYGKLEPCP